MAGIVSIGEEIQSSTENITPQELGQLGDQTLLEIWGFDNEFAIKSDFLQEISESLIQGTSSQEAPISAKNENPKPDEESKKNDK